MRNSISLIKGKKQDYGIGVYLDTDIFEGISPRGWGKELSKFVYANLSGIDTLAYDNDGTPEVIHFAKKGERVQKTGTKNFRRVLDELVYAKGNIEKLSVIHIDELLKTSEVVNTSDEKSHQWLDANGWEHRLTYVQDVYGRIYEATLNIGKSKDGRKILYSVSNVKKVDEVPVSSKSDAQRDWTLSANSKNNYTQKNGNVNRNSRDIFTKADEDYMKAVESGDMETAQRMVDEAAEKALAESKVRDISGKLVHVYHGTSKGGYTVFDTYAYHSKFGLFGNGAYFTEDRSIAEQYTNKGRGDKPQVYDAYLNITNPIDMDAKADISLWNKALERADLDYITLSEGMTNEGAFREVTETLADEGYVLYEAEETVRNIFENMGYDGITHIGGGRANKSDGTKHRVWISFESEQIKSADPVTYDDNGKVIPLSERFNPEKNDIRWSKDVFSEDGVRSSKGLSGEDEKYSYSTLISKPDMKLTIVDEAVPDNRADIIEQAKKNASAVGIVDKTTKAISVYVDDIGDSVIIGAKGLQHGLRRKSTLQTDATSIVTLKAGEIIKNSIRINELTPKYDNVDSAYALIGAAKNSNGDLYIVESVVNRFNNELVSMEVLYSVNAKKENRLSSMLPGIQPPVTDSTISIADLLQYVNRYFPDVLSESVLRQFGYTERPSGALGESVLYSKELFTDDRTMSAEEIENNEIEQMVQSIISSDDLSDADVKAIREEIINNKKLLREKLLADITTTNLARWGMDIGRNENAAKMSIEEAVKKVKDSFGITITDAKDASVAGSAVSSYNENTLKKSTAKTVDSVLFDLKCFTFGFTAVSGPAG
ncbi:MAG: hypothetical protein E7600_09140 [Ruminococcaceae bacterium]|nr:hypothetical protein [Oscillospiraceae bacterium]